MDANIHTQTFVAESVVLGVTSVIKELVPYNPKRRALMIVDNLGGGEMATSRDTLNTVVGGTSAGWPFGGQMPLGVNRIFEGALAQSQWFGLSAGAAPIWTVWEVLEP